MSFLQGNFHLSKNRKIEEEYKLKLKLARQEIQELKSAINAIETRARDDHDQRDKYEQGQKEVADLRESLKTYQDK